MNSVWQVVGCTLANDFLTETVETEIYLIRNKQRKSRHLRLKNATYERVKNTLICSNDHCLISVAASVRLPLGTAEFQLEDFCIKRGRTLRGCEVVGGVVAGKRDLQFESLPFIITCSNSLDILEGQSVAEKIDDLNAKDVGIYYFFKSRKGNVHIDCT